MKRIRNPLASILLLAVSGLAAVFAMQPTVPAKPHTSISAEPAAQFRAEIDNRIAQIISGDASTPSQNYTISDTALAAPKPDAACFGVADSPAELQWLIDQAEELLDGQKLLFSTNTQLLPNSKVHYYLDSTILAITWKEARNRSVFTYSEIKLQHPSQFRRFLSDGEFGSGKLYLTTEMSQSVNAVVACSADFYAYRRKGITVEGGIVHKANRGVPDTCFINRDGDLILERNLAFNSPEDVQKYVDDNNINFSLSFGPILIQDGVNVCPRNYPLGEPNDFFPRAAICQMDRLHYLFAVSNMGKHYYNQLTTRDFTGILMETGCVSAYALDGGQTATIVMNNKLINNVNYGSERLTSDIIYFATAKTAGA